MDFCLDCHGGYSKITTESGDDEMTDIQRMINLVEKMPGKLMLTSLTSFHLRPETQNIAFTFLELRFLSRAACCTRCHYKDALCSPGCCKPHPAAKRSMYQDVLALFGSGCCYSARVSTIEASIYHDSGG